MSIIIFILAIPVYCLIRNSMVAKFRNKIVDMVFDSEDWWRDSKYIKECLLMIPWFFRLNPLN